MSDPAFFIETPRLYLSYFQPEIDSHCDFLVELYNTPEFISSIGGKPTSITTREAARKRLATRFVEEHSRNGYGTYLVSLKPTTDADQTLSSATPFPERLAACALVGTVSLMRGEPPDCFAAPDLGFAILPAYMRRGIATEAAKALMDYVEREKGVKDVLGLCDPKNEGSRATLKRLGFDYRGDMELRVFGGVVGSVWTKPGMEADLAVYGL
ncbi:including n-acetylases of ribosomal protein [Grosmannia clavigera kw1407]|uniref:Including n-acetylases of ribosomal protein n=1 Tax=Grosmannia clavigera (strain kw1407 / UAMH 11150) TaxID=655863 RepID=F0XAR4_GROCL|nr:including n-acetylases of ribosomal protein [Grosmannia clavigera kw1407]EFX05599.1 including n-acetylases of ribosomal protein [Grosmannia clavigera kw1407]